MIIALPEQLAQLRPLRSLDADKLHALTLVNKVHLTEFGDYVDVVAATREDLERELSVQSDDQWRFGIFQDETLMGRVDIVPANPRNFVLGYWLGHAYCGRGLATLACQALMKAAQGTLEIDAFWAGVKHRNVKSVAVLRRLGFELVEDLPTHLRFRRIVGVGERMR
jgi:ribosomal-protein-serine acetyltransferase